MKYAYTILYVSNVAQTVEFYQKAFGFEPKFITPEHDYAELVSGETTIAFASVELGNANFTAGFDPISRTKPPVGVELAFTSENIERDFQQALDAGATEFEPLAQKPWGQTVGYVRDLNGCIIEICTPMQPG